MRVLFTILIGICFFLIKAPDAAAQGCRPKKLIEACKEELPPYSYSDSRTVITKKASSREISVTLLSGESYRLVFNLSKLPDGAVINIYDAKKGERGRDLLKSSKDFPGESSFFVYDPPNKDEGRDIYVSYDIPEPEGMTCFSFVVGYNLSYLDEGE